MRSNLDPELRKPHEIRAFSWGEVKMAIATAGLVGHLDQRDRERKSLSTANAAIGSKLHALSAGNGQQQTASFDTRPMGISPKFAGHEEGSSEYELAAV